ncbi:long-chain fatty acid transport protein [Desulfuromusa kysingii]|uniref:Long-chain fatty acid transport protein n=1 Tax=Desulfuromusa kysingii TaxID=37625 RepID=A0A1H3XDW0_9BACT|nr:outer membrane protein transport protein [Desulfuromusa kysingii]SDZ97595.1 long-chain fatty acid transport protein [Desulfuromusa kysingii]
MKKFLVTSMFCCAAMLLPCLSYATNGDNLIGVGPVSRAMGGTGIAAPQDAISATFSNPAAMNVGPYCPESQFDFASTFFAPKIDAKVTINNGTPLTADSDQKVYMVPAFGISTPINDKMRVGLAAYGVTGLGVDYRDTDIANTGAVDSTQLMILKFAPTFAYQINEKLSVGFAAHLVNSALDLDNGTSGNYGFGGQLGAIYQLTNAFSIGATYMSPINADHQNVYDLDGDGTMDDFALEAPQTLGFGVSYSPSDRFLVALDAKWLNWSDAKGYDDLDWDDQYVIAIGGQFKPTAKLILRLGYNYAENQLKEHSNFDGTTTVKIQGKSVNAYGYETLRIIGFPAISEHHITVGLGYQITETVNINLGYMHAFDSSVKSSGTMPDGTPVELESNLSEDAVDFSLAWQF